MEANTDMTLTPSSRAPFTLGVAVQHLARILCVAVLASVAATVVQTGPRALAYTGTVVFSPPNASQFSGYPRVVRLAHNGPANGRLITAFDTFVDGTDRILLYQSSDDGATWSPLATIADTAYSGRTCCPTLFELPQQVGAQPAGTLLLGDSEGAAGAAGHEIKVWRSTDQGAHWSYLSSCASTTGVPGLWEPDFQIDKNGNLVCYFSDETHVGSGYSQLLGHVVSTDGGATWGPESYDIAVPDGRTRPGMATVSPLPNGQYLMSFEVCGLPNCQDRVKTSPDGDTWGAPTDLGAPIQTSDGRYLGHTAYVAWSPAGGPNGELIATGWDFYNSAGQQLPESGSVLLVNTSLGAGPWSVLPAPFDFTTSGCAGYSSPVLPSRDGKSVLYVAATPLSAGGCEIRAASANAGILPYRAPFAGGTDAGWLTYGGAWSVTNGVYADSSAGPGDKSVAGSTGWTNYTLRGEVELTSAGQAGFVMRVTSPSVGADALNGYYVGLDTGGHFFLGRETGTYTGLTSTTVPGGVSVNTWYHVTVQAAGCTVAASARAVGASGPPATFTYTDANCTLTAGQIGVRDHYTTAAWRDITVSPIGDTE